MSTKPFKDIEQMMKEAADGHEQPFDEAAWQKMEALLDSDKDRKRPIFWLWWLLPLFIGGGIGGYFIFNKTEQSALPVTLGGAKTRSPQSTPGSSKGTGHIVRAPQSPMDLAGSEPGVEEPVRRQKSGHKTSTTIGNRGLNVVGEPGGNVPSTSGRANLIAGTSSAKIQVKKGENMAAADLDNQQTGVFDITPPVILRAETTVPIDTKQSIDNKIPGITKLVQQGNDTLPSVEKNNNKKIRKNDKSSRWYLLVTAGAEGSSPRVFSVDKISARGGMAIGYQLNKNFSLQTGFFAGSKKYTAGPKDYNAKAGTYWSTVEILEVDANCLVYEIPLNVRYDLSPGKTTNIFTSAGLSSYIMKKEDYDYWYNRYGYAHYGEAGYKGNKHLFSVLRLSAGIERKVSKNLSMFAAPALSVPLGGVGEGQVKLYSAEMMLGLKYQPVKKSKNK